MRSPRDFQSLRSEQAQAAINQSPETASQQVAAEPQTSDHSPGPSQGAGQGQKTPQKPSPARGMSGGMAAQNAYQTDNFNYNNAQLAAQHQQRSSGQEAATHAVALEAMNASVDGPQQGGREPANIAPEPGREAAPGQDVSSHAAALEAMNASIDRPQQDGREAASQGVSAPDAGDTRAEFKSAEKEVTQQKPVEIDM